jgi:TusA-related sulfurtransferase
MKADEFIDITDVVCPITFVKVKVALEDMDDGQILAIKLNEGEPVQNIPRSLKDENHKVLELNDNGNGTFNLFVEKGGLK